jgi:hypothetical protein
VRLEDHILFRFPTSSVGVSCSSSSDVRRDVDEERGVNGAPLLVGRARAAAGI